MTVRDLNDEASVLARLGSDLKVKGIGRDAENEKAACIYLSRRPTDDELRAIHEYLKLRGWEIPVNFRVQQ